MSASTKKKLRNAEQTEKLTERQIAEQKEAKKLKIYTAAFIVVTVILLVVALSVGVSQLIDGTGIRQKNSVAMTVGDKEIKAPEMSYFYVDAVQNFYSTNSSFIAYLLDTTAPLNQQIYSSAEGTTWADYFLTIAQSNAEYVYQLCAEAEATGFTLSDSEKTELENYIGMVDLYAQMYGYADGDTYLKAIYGNLANKEGYSSYQEKLLLANSFRAYFADSQIINAADIEEAQKDSFYNYSSYTFNSYYIAASKFLEGGTTDANGTVTYSDEEKAASVAAAEAAAKALCDESIDSVEALDAAIAAMPVNAGAAAQSIASSAVLYSNLDSVMADWLAQEHQEGDKGYVAYETISDDVTTVNGYYVLYYIGRDDNNFQLPTVRHILIGSEDVVNGTASYDEKDLLLYKGEAENVLQQWMDGDKSEESFATLATTLSIDTGSATNGGLYENIVPGQMVETFNDWCFDEHNVGDTGIVETRFGYHVMYFCGLSEQTYREKMVTDALLNDKLTAWFDELAAKYPATAGESKYLPMDMTLS